VDLLDQDLPHPRKIIEEEAVAAAGADHQEGGAGHPPKRGAHPHNPLYFTLINSHATSQKSTLKKYLQILGQSRM